MVGYTFSYPSREELLKELDDIQAANGRATLVLAALPLAMVGDVISWPIAITGAAIMTLVVGRWLGI